MKSSWMTFCLSLIFLFVDSWWSLVSVPILIHLWFVDQLREWLGQTEGDLHILSEHTYDVYLLIFFISPTNPVNSTNH